MDFDLSPNNVWIQNIVYTDTETDSPDGIANAGTCPTSEKKEQYCWDRNQATADCRNERRKCREQTEQGGVWNMEKKESYSCHNALCQGHKEISFE